MHPEYLRFRDAFRKALDPRRYPIEYLDSLVATGAAEIISSDRAAIVFEIRTYPSGARELHGLIAAGALADIAERLIPQAERRAREHGCIGAAIESRPGWARLLRTRDYETYQVALRKEF